MLSGNFYYCSKSAMGSYHQKIKQQMNHSSHLIARKSPVFKDLCIQLILCSRNSLLQTTEHFKMLKIRHTICNSSQNWDLQPNLESWNKYTFQTKKKMHVSSQESTRLTCIFYSHKSSISRVYVPFLSWIIYLPQEGHCQLKNCNLKSFLLLVFSFFFLFL